MEFKDKIMLPSSGKSNVGGWLVRWERWKGNEMVRRER